jgi:putative FmdB family regulatory protein
MPTYEYECSKCKDVFELFQSMKDEPIKKCPECGGKVKRLFGTGAGIIFKGSGFYETDYRSSNYQSDAKKDSSASSSSSSKSSDSKKETSATDTTKKKDKSKASSASKSVKKEK